MKKNTLLYLCVVTISFFTSTITIPHYTETVAGNDSRTSEGEYIPISPRNTKHNIRMRTTYPKKWRNSRDELRSSETEEGPISGPTEQTEPLSTMPRVNPNEPYYERGRLGPWAGQPVQ